MIATTTCLALMTGCVCQDRQPIRIDEPRIRDTLSGIDGLDEVRLAQFGGYTPAALPLYARIIENPLEEPYLVARTLWFLTTIELKTDRERFAELAVGKLSHQRPSVRQSAVELLGQIGNARDTAPVVALHSDTDSTISLSAARTLAVIGDRRALVAMDVWLNSGNHRDNSLLRERVLKCRDELRQRLDKAPPLPIAPPPRPVAH